MKAIYLHTAGAIALTAIVAACSTVPEPTPLPPVTQAPAPTPTPRPAPVTTITEPEYENFLDAPQTQGTWFYEATGSQTRAVFGTTRDTAVFVFACDKASREIEMLRADSSRRERAARIRTETQARMINLTPPSGSGVISARFNANDTILDAMAITKGRFAFETAGMPTLYLPAWVEVSRVIEDCR